MGPIHTTLRYSDDVYELLDELKRNPDAIDPTVERHDVHGTDITVLYDDRVLPCGFLEYVVQYGDLRVEGVDGPRTELLIQL